jgi:hypothetical protein
VKSRAAIQAVTKATRSEGGGGHVWRRTRAANTLEGGDLAIMGGLTGGRGVVVVIRVRRRNQARCTCGWIGKASLLLASAKVDALLHAARNDCDPGVPLFQPGAVVPTKSQSVLKPDNSVDPTSQA